jgi:hypothetical protein
MEMLLNKDWHTITPIFRTENDRAIISQFLEALPMNFNQFFDHKTSNLLELIPLRRSRYINRTNLTRAYNEATSTFNTFLFSEVNPLFNESFNWIELEWAGLTKRSLKVKISLLNSLWHRITEYVANKGLRFLNFLDQGLRDLLEDFIRFLNVFLRSLRALFPQVEVFCELGEVILGVPLIA